jgi:hypothetical protein
MAVDAYSEVSTGAGCAYTITMQHNNFASIQKNFLPIHMTRQAIACVFKSLKNKLADPNVVLNVQIVHQVVVIVPQFVFV